jgi:hypothetical protein
VRERLLLQGKRLLFKLLSPNKTETVIMGNFKSVNDGGLSEDSLFILKLKL